MEAHYQLQGRMVPEWHLLPHSWGSISNLRSAGGGSAGILTYQSMSILLNLGMSTTSWSLGVEHFQSLLDISCELYVSSSCIGSPSSVHISDRTCQRSIQTSYSYGILLDGAFLASHSSQHVSRLSSLVSCCKKTCNGCCSGLGAQGSTIAAFSPLAAQMCSGYWGSLPQSLTKWQGKLKCLWQS